MSQSRAGPLAMCREPWGTGTGLGRDPGSQGLLSSCIATYSPRGALVSPGALKGLLPGGLLPPVEGLRASAWQSRGFPTAGHAVPELASPARRLVPSGVDRAGTCHPVCQGAALWSLCTCFCARALLGICAHSSEPALGLFLLQGTTRAPPRLLGASQGSWGSTGSRKLPFPAVGSLGLCTGHLVGRAVLRRPRDLRRSLWPWTFLTFGPTFPWL